MFSIVEYSSIKHHELANEFRQIHQRYENALKYDFSLKRIYWKRFVVCLFSGQDIGSYTQDDFLRDIRELQTRINKRNDLIETHVLKVKSSNYSSLISLIEISRFQPLVDTSESRSKNYLVNFISIQPKTMVQLIRQFHLY